MRNLRQPHKRSCPQCGNFGFAKVGTDFYGLAQFQCNDCRYEWTSERGPQRGTGLDRIEERVGDYE